MSEYETLAEKANAADYAAQDYKTLCELNFAFTWALGNIQKLMPIKRMEEMSEITRRYVTDMNRYLSTRKEIESLLDKEYILEIPAFSDVDEQEDGVSVSYPNEKLDKCIPLLALPESEVSIQEGVSPPETDVQSPMRMAIDMHKDLPIGEGIDVNLPYYTESRFRLKDEEIKHRSSSRGKNLDTSTLEGFRESTTIYLKYIRGIDEKDMVSSDALIAYKDDEEYIVVRTYHFTEKFVKAEEMPNDTTNKNEYPTYTEVEEEKRTQSLLRRALKQARERSHNQHGLDYACIPYYEGMKFRINRKNLEIVKEFPRKVFDETTLVEIASAFEVYARNYYNDKVAIMSKDYSVAVMIDGVIYVLFINIPYSDGKKNKRLKNTDTAEHTSDNESPIDVPVSSVNDDMNGYPLVKKAIDITKAHHVTVSDGIDILHPYYIQEKFGITNDGDIVIENKPFSNMIGDVSNEMNVHMRYAKMMSNGNIFSSNDYIAYISKDGKHIHVYYYHNTRPSGK